MSSTTKPNAPTTARIQAMLRRDHLYSAKLAPRRVDAVHKREARRIFAGSAPSSPDNLPIARAAPPRPRNAVAATAVRSVCKCRYTGQGLARVHATQSRENPFCFVLQTPTINAPYRYPPGPANDHRPPTAHRFFSHHALRSGRHAKAFRRPRVADGAGCPDCT